MQNIFAPWRIEYILNPKPEKCIFCPEGNGESDDERLILYRGVRSMVIMNRYPYNNGHLMVCPWRHISDLSDLNKKEADDIFYLINFSIAALKDVMNPGGFNIGLNIGSAAGAGIKEHLHYHIVPRWDGDTNFMAVSTEVRVIPEHLKSTFLKLKPYFKDVKLGGDLNETD